MYNTWYDEAALQPYTWLMEYNPDKAKELLDAAGFVDKDGDGWRDNPDGTRRSRSASRCRRAGPTG